jgi:hypothetical protein
MWQVGRVLGFNLSILILLYIVWAALPVGIDLEPRISCTATLTSQERQQVLSFLASENAIYTGKDWMKIYRETFWRPWSRRVVESSVLIDPAGVAFTVAGIKRDENGAIGAEYVAFRDDGELKFELRGHPMERY